MHCITCIYSMQCILCIGFVNWISCIVFNALYLMYFIICIIFFKFCLHTVISALYSLHYILYIVSYALCPMHCVLCIVSYSILFYPLFLFILFYAFLWFIFYGLYSMFVSILKPGSGRAKLAAQEPSAPTGPGGNRIRKILPSVKAFIEVVYWELSWGLRKSLSKLSTPGRCPPDCSSLGQTSTRWHCQV